MELTARRAVGGGVVLVVVAVVALSFAADLGSARPEPVPFDETVERGLSAEHSQIADERGVSVPKTEVFYSQYRYVVGYVGVEQAVAALREPGHEQQFGYPLTVYVSDYSGADPRCSGDGLLRVDVFPDWVPADRAHYVVGSDARVPGGTPVVPFAERADAARFVDACGGSVVGWDGLQSRSFDIDRASAVRSQVEPRHEWADSQVQAARERADRPVSVVVGRDEPTLAAAVEAAPANTTVRVPPGTYDGDVTIDKPLTVAGSGTRLRGNGTGSVVTVSADHVALVDLTIDGVGNETLGSPDVNGSDDGAWDHTVQQAYGNSDAGVTARNVSAPYVHNVTVETPASGFVLRRTPGAVLDGVAVDGTDEWDEGFMGVVGMHDRLVVQNATVSGGRDGVYLHRAHGTVVRNNSFHGGRFGTHLMYTSRALIADNVAREQLYSGVVVMTNPRGNAVVGNDIRRSGSGIMMAGARSYVAHNVVVDTGRALSTNAGQSVYEHNVLYGNEIGVAASTVVPSNRVVENDFVANERHAVSGPGPLRVYTHDGRGNYWSGAYGQSGSGPTLDRPYSPTDPVDRRLHRSDAAVVVREAPSVAALRELRGTTPGFRSASIVDRAPLRSPANPAVVERVRNRTQAMEADE
ncbi:NosD domain-containing protein [Haloarcula pelagica]|uniref:NosD domain-containing protein n=1 Tax=Haloarcula pelagica TaxID=3033389 RepID=UPI0024C424A5|nr:NosD domain-containing protein [Halomicroarcula sp. YJ-61-S]